MKFDYAGLDAAAVEQSRRDHGANAITTQETETFLDKLIGNLKDPIIIILMVALVITIVLAILGFSPWYEGVGIAIAVALATLISTWSEYSNESAFQRLLEEASLIQIRVFRDGRLVEIPINEAVVGDILLLKPGDNIPADGWLVAGDLKVAEAALTGESEPLVKTAVPEGEAEPDARRHKLYRASLVDDGEAVMRITAVGDRTEYGKTMREVLSAEDRLSPLQEKLSVLGGHISTFGYIGAPLIAAAFMFNHIFLESAGFEAYFALPVGQIVADVVTALTLAIIIIVVAVPEGLPMMIAIVLSMNMKRLLHAKVLVRKLLGIETAGSLTVLFTDKTGTLTRGELAAASFLGGDGAEFHGLDSLPGELRGLLGFSLRNNSGAVIDGSDPDNPGIVGADRTEAALLRFLGRDLVIDDNVNVTASIAFNSSRKFSATQVSQPRALTLVKGAPEVVLANCTRYHDGEKRQPLDRAQLDRAMDGLTDRAMRLIAVAVTDAPITDPDALPTDLQLVGVFGLRDDLRPESRQGVADAQSAGIQVVMITGDARETAEAIARDAGLLNIPEPKLLTSEELNALDDNAVKALLPELRVVARAFPTDKSRLVRLAKELGWVVGMTGDGVNDAPAVKNADVGFAMGSGTEMTKESSDIVILDDNFASLTQAALYGRTLFKSIRKFLVFQLTVNVSAILLAFLGPFFGYDLPLTMVQLLWINIIMDTLAALAFSGEPALHRYMRESPIPKDASLITGDMWSAILIDGIAATILSLIFLTWSPIRGAFHSEAAFLTGFFGFFVFMHNFNKFNARTENIHLGEHLSENRNFLLVIGLIFVLQVVFTYIGGEVLRTVGLTLGEWLLILVLGALIIPVDLTRKLIRNRFFGNPVVADEPDPAGQRLAPSAAGGNDR